MTKTTTNVAQIPLGNSKFAEWYKEAIKMMEEVNITGAKIWVRKNVPAQFQQYINEAVEREYIRRHRLTKG